MLLVFAHYPMLHSSQKRNDKNIPVLLRNISQTLIYLSRPGRTKPYLLVEIWKFGSVGSQILVSVRRPEGRKAGRWQKQKEKVRSAVRVMWKVRSSLQTVWSLPPFYLFLSHCESVSQAQTDFQISLLKKLLIHTDSDLPDSSSSHPCQSLLSLSGAAVPAVLSLPLSF